MGEANLCPSHFAVINLVFWQSQTDRTIWLVDTTQSPLHSNLHSLLNIMILKYPPSRTFAAARESRR
jgi:hypothetical protein